LCVFYQKVTLLSPLTERSYNRIKGQWCY